MSEKLRVKVSSVILSTDIPNNKKYVLSTDKNKISLPYFYLDNTNYNNIKNTIYESLKDKMVISPLELMPSFITINQDDLPEDMKNSEILNIVYGSVIPLNQQNINDLYWVEFNLLLSTPYSNLLFQVIHSLS